MKDSLIITLPPLLHSSVIEGKAKRLIDEQFEISSLVKEANYYISVPSSVKVRLERGIVEMQTKSNKVAFLSHLLTHFSVLLTKLNDGTLDGMAVGKILTIDNINNTKPLIEEIVFELVQQLDILGIDTATNAFSLTEFQKVTVLLMKILDDLELVKAGNAILGDQVEELENDIQEIKSSMVMGKKPFYQRMTGVIATYVATKGADEVYDAIRPSLEEISKVVLDQIQIDVVMKALNQ